MDSTSAIVIAGGPTEDRELACLAPGGCKSLIRVNGRPAVAYVVDSLKRCEAISRVILVGDSAAFDAADGADELVEAPDGQTAGIIAGIRAAAGSSRCVVVAGDMPLVSPEAAADLVASAPEADVVCPVVEKSDVESAFPGKSSFYVPTREGQYAGSTCLAFRPDAALAQEERICRLLELRQNPEALLGMVSPGFMVKFVLSKLTLRDIEEQLSQVVGLDCRVFVSRYPELVVSIETDEDLRMIQSALERAE